MCMDFNSLSYDVYDDGYHHDLLAVKLGYYRDIFFNCKQEDELFDIELSSFLIDYRLAFCVDVQFFYSLSEYNNLYDLSGLLSTEYKFYFNNSSNTTNVFNFILDFNHRTKEYYSYNFMNYKLL